MTISEISLLLKIYSTPRVMLSLYPDEIYAGESLLLNDMINVDNEVTERGRAWVKYILSLPYPVQQWVMP